MRRNLRLLIGCAISILLLGGFLLIEHFVPDLLSLEPEWLGLAAIPTVIGLVAAGYIRAFKGFGIEVETSLQNAIGNVPLGIKDVQGVDMVKKSDRGDLDALTTEQRESAARLRFVLGSGEYTLGMVYSYLQALPNLRYIELVSRTGRLKALVPINAVREGDKPSENKVMDFVNAVADSDPGKEFITPEASASLRLGTPLLEALESFKKHGLSEMPVTDRGRMVGIASESVLQSRLLEALRAAQKKT